MSKAIDERPIPNRIQELCWNWKWLHRAWWGSHYTIGIIGIFAGGMAAAAGAGAEMFKSTSWGWLSGLFAAVATSLVTFLGPLQRAERYWSAFHEIDQACLEYESGLIDMACLNRRTKMARGVVLGGSVTNNRTDENQPSSPPRANHDA